MVPEPITAPRLSICIATWNRARFIGETLDSIVPQLVHDVELLVLDGASPDDTGEVVARYAGRDPRVRYIREDTNSGVDRDYDKAVEHARGRHCWLMTDDDLLLPGAVSRVLAAIADGPDLLVVNAEVRSVDLSTRLQERLLDIPTDREYTAEAAPAFFADVAAHLKFIGAVVIARDAWLRRARAPYFGTLFIHVGVIFQSPAIERVRVLAEPVLAIRYGNAMWTPRGFEIWMYKWPRLVWGFDGYADETKARVSAREPWRKLAKLGVHRALGGFSAAELPKHFGAGVAWSDRAKARMVAMLPAPLANALACTACLAMPQKARLNLYDLARAPSATWLSRSIARRLGVIE